MAASDQPLAPPKEAVSHADLKREIDEIKTRLRIPLPVFITLGTIIVSAVFWFAQLATRSDVEAVQEAVTTTRLKETELSRDVKALDESVRRLEVSQEKLSEKIDTLVRPALVPTR